MTAATETRIAGLLGISMRAGLITSGQEQCVAMLRAGKAAVAFVDAQASDNTKKRMKDACAAHGAPLYELSAGTLGKCIGKAERMTVTMGACGLSQRMLSLLEGEARE